MIRFIFLTFAFLAWGFWELSGGADFVPETRKAASVAAVAPPEAETEVIVTRSVTAPSRIAIEAEPEAEIVPARLETAVVSAPEPEAEPDVFLFESLVEGAPTVADILPETEITVTSPDAAAETDVQPVSAPEISGDLRQVAGTRVNMRSGPGTEFGVVTTLSRGADVEVFEVNASGWARLRNVATGQEGWMAERLLSGG